MQGELVTVERIQIDDYDGLLYNLETESEDYVVAGIVIHNCPHFWEIHADKVTAQECEILWMGE